MLGVTAWLPQAAAASELTVLHSGPLHEALFAVAFSGADGLVVGAAGEIRQSQDAGRSWIRLAPPPVSAALLGVSLDGGNAVAVGQAGTILFRRGGQEWQQAQSGSEERLLAVDLKNGLAVAVGAFGTILRSHDDGRSWEAERADWDALNEGTEPHLYAVQIWGEGRVTLAGEFGLILRSDDGGVSWRKQHGGKRSIFALELHEDGRGFAVGQDGKALATSDGGESWTPLELGTAANLFGVTFSDRVIQVAGMYELMSSGDGGRSWLRPKGRAGIEWVSGLATVPGTHSAIGVGNSGVIAQLEP